MFKFLYDFIIKADGEIYRCDKSLISTFSNIVSNVQGNSISFPIPSIIPQWKFQKSFRKIISPEN
jgi:hypothetical protein